MATAAGIMSEQLLGPADTPSPANPIRIHVLGLAMAGYLLFGRNGMLFAQAADAMDIMA